MLKEATFYLVLTVAPVSAIAEDIPTRFGTLKINDANTLLYKGRALSPPIQGSNSLRLLAKFQLAASDILLIQDNNGTGCPAQFYFVDVSASGLKSTAAFGTCSDLVEAKQKAEAVSVTMPGFMGPFESKAAQAKASKEKHLFLYKDGLLTQNGKPIPAPEDSGTPSMSNEAKETESAKSSTTSVQVENALKVHRNKIASLGLSQDMLKSTVYVNYLGVDAPCCKLEDWIALVMQRKNFQRVQAIEFQGGRYKGVSFKFEGRPSFGFLFRIDPPDSFLSHLVPNGDQVEPLNTPGKQSQGAMIFMQMAKEPQE